MFRKPHMTPISSQAWQAIELTLQLAVVTTAILLLLATPLAWWLAQRRSIVRSWIGVCITLPLVLPPTVLGFYLLVLLGPNGWVGAVTEWLGVGLLSFTFSGLVIGSVIFSLPFAVLPIQHAFQALGSRPFEVAATLRASAIDSFFSVALPQAKTGILTAAVLTFAHTLGEFGVVLMIGGNVPGQTQVVSTQIFEYVEAMQYQQAHWLSAAMVLFSFLVLFFLSRLNGRRGATL
jgi:molybdate transport system permease protein